ncbi:hypothetical protein B566_EDAN004593 [Ephemera danica]|nr:hypothetical protein B566_EDAN004593 [Ephemera danica]
MFLMSSPFPGLLILALYLRFVNVWGPRFMQNRPAYNLERLIIAYNTLNVIVSAWLFKEAYISAWGNGYSLKCQPVDFSDDPNALRIMRCCYVYFILKIVELLDTVFFILRKKFNQASFLHVYHHTGMVMLAWGGVKYLPGGHGTFLGFINTFVHVVMYAYYLITALYPQYKKNIWWKKHITQMQIIQFAMITIHSLQLLFRDCDYPSWTVSVVVPQNLFMMLLFTDFYRKAYLAPARKQPSNGQEDRNEINGGPKQS